MKLTLKDFQEDAVTQLASLTARARSDATEGEPQTLTLVQPTGLRPTTQHKGLRTLAPRRNATTPARIAIAERERRALELRKTGATFEQIAAALGYTNRGTAHTAVKRALADTIQEPADELRRLELERLDALLGAMWPLAMAGKGYAVERCLQIMDRKAKLLGLDAPTRRVVDVITHDAFAAAMAELEVEIAQLEAAGGTSYPG